MNKFTNEQLEKIEDPRNNFPSFRSGDGSCLEAKLGKKGWFRRR